MSGLKPVIGGSGVFASSIGGVLLFDGSTYVTMMSTAKIVLVGLVVWAFVYWMVRSRFFKRNRKS